MLDKTHLVAQLLGLRVVPRLPHDVAVSPIPVYPNVNGNVDRVMGETLSDDCTIANCREVFPLQLKTQFFDSPYLGRLISSRLLVSDKVDHSNAIALGGEREESNGPVIFKSHHHFINAVTLDVDSQVLQAVGGNGYLRDDGNPRGERPSKADVHCFSAPANLLPYTPPVRSAL